jgi:hypothetical protein
MEVAEVGDDTEGFVVCELAHSSLADAEDLGHFGGGEEAIGVAVLKVHLGTPNGN